MKDDPFRRSGVIETVKHYFEDHVGQWTSYVFVKYDKFGTQGFGGYGHGREKGNPLDGAYVRELCSAFGVRKLDDLVGKRCIALFEEKGFNAMSRGLESEETGRRFTIRGWLKRNLPKFDDVPTYERNLREIDETINRTRNTLESLKEERASMASSDFRDWND